MGFFCEYKNIFGKPNEGIHSYRLGSLAMVDLFGLLVLVFAYASYYNVDIIATLIVGIVLTVFIHWLFCVPTALNRKLGVA